MSAINNHKVKQYIHDVCSLVKNNKVHKNISDELQCHIEDIVEEYIEHGFSEDEAIEKALVQMGSYKDVGTNLDKVHKAPTDWPLISMTAALILFGLFTLWYLGKDTLYVDGGLSNNSFAIKTGVYSLIGGIIGFVVIKTHYRKLKKYSMHVYIGTMIASVILVNLGVVINGARGYLVIGPISFNILNIAQLLFIISLAGIFDKYDWNNLKNWIKGIALAFIPTLLFISFVSSASAIIYTIAALTLMIISGARVKDILIAIASLGGVFVLFVIKEPYRVSRLLSFLYPMEDPQGTGWVYNQLNKIRHSSGLFGKDEILKVAQLPEMHTDFIFTYIMYSFGFIACLLLIVLVLGFIVRIGLIGARTKDSYGKLLVMGLCALFASQFVLNILMNFTLSPILAIGMPFVSYSGTSMVINFIAIGIITSVYKWRNTPYCVSK